MRALLAAVAGLAAFPAFAEPFVFSGTAQAGLGYATDPRLLGDDGGSASATMSFSPTLVRRSERSTTVVGGSYNREQYFRRYDFTDSALGYITHSTSFDEHLRGNARVAYSSSNNPLIGPDTAVSPIDPVTLGQRTKSFDANGSLEWQPTSLDTFNVGANFSRVTYSGSGVGLVGRDYSQIGAQAGYSRSIDARTQAGIQINASQVDSEAFPDSHTIQASLTLKRLLSNVWTFDGRAGVILQGLDGGSTTASLGFGASLCGKYSLTDVCFNASRQSAASGAGGLRTSLQISATLVRQLTARSRVNALVSYDESNSNGDQFGFGDARTIQARATYTRDLTQRIGIGFTARYQDRHMDGGIDANSIAGTINLTAKLGRIS